MIRKGKWKRKQKGQAVVEYVILVVVVAMILLPIFRRAMQAAGTHRRLH